ncbi:NAD(+)--rifampin ADP-ribosyltransferase [Leptolyngbya sp. AN03gr2]|uniref:NAD(+)--rifampin ADP-ribosyltransferase n=1 Tax=unclassified Leptolyngbya TaxID=2650499 RepID=UPI003D312BEE
MFCQYSGWIDCLLPSTQEAVHCHRPQFAASRLTRTDVNYGQQKQATYVYLAATLDAATWGAELALGEGRARIYIVEPTGLIEDDPNVTNQKFPGNPTKSYRSREPLLVIGEVIDWQGHSPEALKTMKENLEQLKQLGIEAIED